MTTKDIFEVIHERRSIRNFTDEKIKREDLITIAEAARATPTSINLQQRKFTMVQNKELIKKLAQALGSVMGQRDYDFYNPDAIFLISSPRGYNYSQIETGLAVQNTYLAATALGYGTVWTDQIRNNCDEVPVREVLDEMQIPSNHICWTILPIVIPASQPTPKDRVEEINIIAD